MNQQSFIYNFLLAPQCRIWRYLALVGFFTIVSLNQALVGYLKLIPQIGNNLYWIVAGTILMYIVTVIVLKKLVVKHLMSGRYLLFLFYIILYALLYVSISNIVYSYYIEEYDFFSEVTIIDNISAFVIFILCISGVIIPVFLKNWMVSNQHLNKLKIKQVSSQVEQFKEQITPPSFFKILGKSKDVVKSEPEKASAMLMKLSQLLRYQLYDCNRQQVLLTAEISFLHNFLDLEKLGSPTFDYSIETEGNINGIFVSPSVLLPFVQSVRNALNGERQVVAVRLSNSEEAIRIALQVFEINNTILLQKELLKVKERLNALYKDRYDLAVANDKSAGKAEVVLQLYKE